MIELFLLNTFYETEIISHKSDHHQYWIKDKAAAPGLLSPVLHRPIKDSEKPPKAETLLFACSAPPYLVEHRRPVLMFVQAGNILTNTAARGLVLWRDVDLILKYKHRVHQDKNFMIEVEIKFWSAPFFLSK